MNPIERAILQDEIRQALNALFKSGQVGRTETKTVLSAPLVEAEFESESGIKLEEGKKYTVSLDSGDYEAVCKSHSFDGENTFYYLGDIAIFWEQFEPTEDSFVVVGNEAFVIAIDKDEGGYIHIQTETIHPIDPKFIPGAVEVDLTEALNSVEYNNGVGQGHATVSDEVRENLIKGYNVRNLCIVFDMAENTPLHIAVINFVQAVDNGSTVYMFTGFINNIPAALLQMVQIILTENLVNITVNGLYALSSETAAPTEES